MTFSRALFSPHVGTTFNVHLSSEHALSLQLQEVRQPNTMPPGYEVFSLIFHGVSAQPLPQGTYALQHAELAEQAIFLVPVGKRDHGFEYQACFNIVI
ncbi:hypothetical protein SAMN02745857_03994 [Andreprevotia lacus DSM 23236]|jgi:hypothetical protein|uniref:DUF6916 domain-containing protein n=1 Tax=Andreprevotia lacus DSM 23236 TaxID=1121001 RepID=A0A1W1Y1M0_9NEIS|nr:hypothetical protein [Andreprevotia lacus]SMC29658.1 hypothetical protein SAMN02745857_03994 [Andreprevotia lacus DSM 23236]